MAKTKISEYSSTAASNTDVANINIAEGCSPSNLNNAIRAVMSHLKDLQAGNVVGNAIAVASGGTGAENATDARTNLGLGALSTLATVDTAQIDDDAITTAKILDANVTSAKIADSNITTDKIADDAVTSAKVAENAIDATALNVSGDGTSGQALISDGDGSFSWDDVVTGSVSSSGYITLSNGLMVQWGSVTSTIDTAQTFSFPTTFPTACFVVLCDIPTLQSGNTKTTSNFTVDRDDNISGSRGGYFIAIGN